ncbi:MAG: hypothetical protein KatS3mg068_2256 [Candidatus Sericytochromatia bacterium]|nr:MAG: hypothetical protein KatS3mg068_2256 [Candidatus Sericytochromatia bacterium]
MDLEYLLEKESIFWLIEDFFILKICGNDAQSYLNTQTSNDVKSLLNNKGLDNNLLDRKGHLIAPFSLHKIDDYMIAISQEITGNNLMRHLEKYHFTEDFYMENITNDYKLISLQGYLSDDIIEKIFNLSLLKDENDICKLNQNYIIKKSLSYEDGYLLLVNKKEFSFILDNLKNLSYQAKKDEVEEIRILSGIPLYNIDMDANNIISETGREKFSVSYTKGCYLGQEVVARIKNLWNSTKML